ncbi:contactin [Aphis craccivora]|uniref:Contactin n=1 Tax=Aphis craccivora TaxID=307492 RepID=A0A6G0Z0B4_APHCR|nr:contactin [Aphis craccivora]
MIKSSYLCVLAVLWCSTPSTWSQINNLDTEWHCPQHWIQYSTSCYKFVKSPYRPRSEARRNCLVCVLSVSKANAFVIMSPV